FREPLRSFSLSRARRRSRRALPLGTRKREPMLENTDAQQGRLAAIWLKRAHRGPMDPVAAADLVEGQGVAGSVDRSPRRQVTILSEEAWNACMRELHADLDPSTRRANLLVSGIQLAHTRERVLRVGDAR